MKNKCSKDVGEEIISRLKELNRLLESIFKKNKNEKELLSAPKNRD